MTNKNKYVEYLNIGLIQTTLNFEMAWTKGPIISYQEQISVWDEIINGLRELNNNVPKPHLVILPELSVPNHYLFELDRISRMMGVIIIAGLDYALDQKQKTVKNRGVILVPGNWPSTQPSKTSYKYYFGKTYASEYEKKKLINFGWTFIPDPILWLLESTLIGKIGVNICYDFLDVERHLLYRGNIHHMLVLAYNKDINSFYHIAESLARTLHCNVVVCNTGYFGGSVAVSPYFDPWRRTIYRHEGKCLFTTQIISLPVKKLEDSQKRKSVITQNKIKVPQRLFKNLPPGIKFN